MAMILVYKCSKNCGLRAPLHIGFPVFREDTPQNMQKVPVRRINSEYVTGYTNEEACLACSKIVAVSNPEAFALLDYQRATEEWESKSLLVRLVYCCTGVEKPRLRECHHIENICPECGVVGRFLTERMMCNLCGEGEVIVDDKNTAYF